MYEVLWGCECAHGRRGRFVPRVARQRTETRALFIHPVYNFVT